MTFANSSGAIHSPGLGSGGAAVRFAAVVEIMGVVYWGKPGLESDNKSKGDVRLGT